jgi:O-antigen/teichoic acid export membrane protein
MSLVKRSGIYLGANILNAMVPFFLLPVLTRYLTTAEYGQIAMFQTLVTGLTALTGLNVVGAANRKYYDDLKDSFALFNGACVYILIISSFILGVTSLFFSNTLSGWFSIPSEWVYIAIFISSANFIIQLRLGQWQIRERVISFGIMQVTQGILVLVLSLMLVVWWGRGALGRIEALFVATALFAVVSLWLLHRDRLLQLLPFRKDFCKEALFFGVPLVPHVIGIFLLSSIDRFFISQRLGIAEAGIYMLAVQLSLGIAIVFDAINKALVPWLFRTLSDNKPEQLQRIVKFTYLFFIIVFLLGCLSFVVGPWVVSWVAGKEYRQAGSVIGWLCMGQAFGGMYLMVTNYLFFAKKTGMLSLVTISTGMLNILLLLFMIKINGSVGVAMAFSLSMCIRFFATWWLASRLKLVKWCIF